jgi:hypothetical protein
MQQEQIPTTSITATSSSFIRSSLARCSADVCNDGTLTTEWGEVCKDEVCRGYYTNLRHTNQGDTNPTMTFTYPCQQGLSKAVIYNWRLVYVAQIVCASPC